MKRYLKKHSQPQKRKHIHVLQSEPEKKKRIYGEEVFKCSHCLKTFTTSKHLKRHINVKHTSVKRFTCEICRREFLRKEYYNKHKCITNKIKTRVNFDEIPTTKEDESSF